MKDLTLAFICFGVVDFEASFRIDRLQLYRAVLNVDLSQEALLLSWIRLLRLLGFLLFVQLLVLLVKLARLLLRFLLTLKVLLLLWFALPFSKGNAPT